MGPNATNSPAQPTGMPTADSCQRQSVKMTCKGVSQTIPMKLVTTKFGVDYWTMPVFNFLDEPMQLSIIVVRQLLQYVQTLFAT